MSHSTGENNFANEALAVGRAALALTALKTLNCHYGHVGEASDFFESMKPVVETKYNALNHYFSSHPESIERINALWQEAKILNFTVREVTPLPSLLAHSKK